MDINRFRTNKEWELNGVWVDLGDGAQVKVARHGNPNHKRVVRELLKPYKQQVRNETLSDEIAERIQKDALIECLLLDWRGIELDGEELPFNRENVAKALQIEDFYNDVRFLTESFATFQSEELEHDRKN